MFMKASPLHKSVTSPTLQLKGKKCELIYYIIVCLVVALKSKKLCKSVAVLQLMSRVSMIRHRCFSPCQLPSPFFIKSSSPQRTGFPASPLLPYGSLPYPSPAFRRWRPKCKPQDGLVSSGKIIHFCASAKTTQWQYPARELAHTIPSLQSW